MIQIDVYIDVSFVSFEVSQNTLNLQIFCSAYVLHLQLHVSLFDV